MSEFVKGVLLFWTPLPGYVAGEAIKWLSNLAEVFDETAVEMHETSEFANV